MSRPTIASIAALDHADRRQLREARHVILTLQRFDNPHLPRVVSADEIGGGLTLLATAQVDEMRVFAQDQLGPLTIGVFLLRRTLVESTNRRNVPR